jgi:hypothetical protein
MKPTRKLSRRSFLTRVAGGAIVGGGAMIALTGGARAFQVTDSDAGATADPPNGGRGGANRRIRGCTDGDSGASADPAGNGRGSRRTDADPQDQPGCGRRR